MTSDLVNRVELACTKRTDQSIPVTFAAVAADVGLAKATLYRRPELRAIVEEHRARNRDAHTLSGIIVELDQLRHGLEAVANKVRRHEELIRDLQRRTKQTR